MAWLIASRMLAAGHTCVGLWSRNNAGARALGEAYLLPQLAAPEELHDGPDACILAVSDAAITEIAQQLALRRTTLIHTAGSASLEAVSSQAANAGVVWPLYSIRKESLPQHRAFPVLIEATTLFAASTVQDVAGAISDIIYEADTYQRQWLHLAAVFGNNFVNHLLGLAADICAAKGLPASLMQPIIEQTMSSLQTIHPHLSQTGPAKRHDTVTMDQHLQMLEGAQQMQELYKCLSVSIKDLFPLPSKG
jgi:predicted short-subunit dehydrogenase-like oxidoreductase (DUF2520 family)